MTQDVKVKVKLFPGTEGPDGRERRGEGREGEGGRRIKVEQAQHICVWKYKLID